MLTDLARGLAGVFGTVFFAGVAALLDLATGFAFADGFGLATVLAGFFAAEAIFGATFLGAALGALTGLLAFFGIALTGAFFFVLKTSPRLIQSIFVPSKL